MYKLAFDIDAIQNMTDEQISTEIGCSLDRSRAEKRWEDALRTECKARADRSHQRYLAEQTAWQDEEHPNLQGDRVWEAEDYGLNMVGYVHVGFTPAGSAWNVYLHERGELSEQKRQDIAAMRRGLMRMWKGNTFHVDGMTTAPIWESTVRDEHCTGYHRDNGIPVPQPLTADEMVEKLKADRESRRQCMLKDYGFEKVTAGWIYTQLTDAMVNPGNEKYMVQFMGFQVTTQEKHIGDRRYIPQVTSVTGQPEVNRDKVAMLREKIANGYDGEFYWSNIYRAIRPVSEMTVLDLDIDSNIYRNSVGRIVRD